MSPFLFFLPSIYCVAVSAENGLKTSTVRDNLE